MTMITTMTTMTKWHNETMTHPVLAFCFVEGYSESLNDQGKICFLLMVLRGIHFHKSWIRRYNDYMAQKDQHTVHIMGGTSSNPFLPCLKSEEVLDLRYPESGWQLKNLNVLEYYIVFQEKRSDYWNWMQINDCLSTEHYSHWPLTLTSHC